MKDRQTIAGVGELRDVTMESLGEFRKPVRLLSFLKGSVHFVQSRTQYVHRRAVQRSAAQQCSVAQ
jgi:hypothetical protein